jgi:hypothetical protein
MSKTASKSPANKKQRRKDSDLDSGVLNSGAAADENANRAGRSPGKKNKKFPAPQIVSEGLIAKKKRGWESDFENPDDQLEEGEEEESPDDTEHQAVSHSVKKAKGTVSVGILQTQAVVELLKCAHAEILNFKKYIKSVNISDEVVDRKKHIDPDLFETIHMVLYTDFGDEADEWLEWDDDTFFERLLACCPDESTSGQIPGGLSAKDRLLALKMNYSVWHLARVVELKQSIIALMKLMDESDLTESKE